MISRCLLQVALSFALLSAILAAPNHGHDKHEQRLPFEKSQKLGPGAAACGKYQVPCTKVCDDDIDEDDIFFEDKTSTVDATFDKNGKLLQGGCKRCLDKQCAKKEHLPMYSMKEEINVDDGGTPDGGKFSIRQKRTKYLGESCHESKVYKEEESIIEAKKEAKEALGWGMKMVQHKLKFFNETGRKEFRHRMEKENQRLKKFEGGKQHTCSAPSLGKLSDNLIECGKDTRGGREASKMRQIDRLTAEMDSSGKLSVKGYGSNASKGIFGRGDMGSFGGVLDLMRDTQQEYTKFEPSKKLGPAGATCGKYEIPCLKVCDFDLDDDIIMEGKSEYFRRNFTRIEAKIDEDGKLKSCKRCYDQNCTQSQDHQPYSMKEEMVIDDDGHPDGDKFFIKQKRTKFLGGVCSSSHKYKEDESTFHMMRHGKNSSRWNMRGQNHTVRFYNDTALKLFSKRLNKTRHDLHGAKSFHKCHFNHHKLGSDSGNLLDCHGPGAERFGKKQSFNLLQELDVSGRFSLKMLLDSAEGDDAFGGVFNKFQQGERSVDMKPSNKQHTKEQSKIKDVFKGKSKDACDSEDKWGKQELKMKGFDPHKRKQSAFTSGELNRKGHGGVREMSSKHFDFKDKKFHDSPKETDGCMKMYREEDMSRFKKDTSGCSRSSMDAQLKQLEYEKCKFSKHIDDEYRKKLSEKVNGPNRLVKVLTCDGSKGAHQEVAEKVKSKMSSAFGAQKEKCLGEVSSLGKQSSLFTGMHSNRGGRGGFKEAPNFGVEKGGSKQPRNMASGAGHKAQPQQWAPPKAGEGGKMSPSKDWGNEKVSSPKEGCDSMEDFGTFKSKDDFTGCSEESKKELFAEFKYEKCTQKHAIDETFVENLAALVDKGFKKGNDLCGSNQTSNGQTSNGLALNQTASNQHTKFGLENGAAYVFQNIYVHFLSAVLFCLLALGLLAQ